MGAYVVGHTQPDMPAEFELLVAIVRRAVADARYRPQPGSRYRRVRPDDQKDARDFLAEVGLAHLADDTARAAG